jgi:hypothetical protein
MYTNRLHDLSEDILTLLGVECMIKVKGKICPCALTEHHAMKAYWGSGGIAPCIL